MNAICNHLLPDGTIGITEDGILCIELPAPGRNVFAMTAIPNQYGYECSFPGGVRNGVQFDINNPETFTICDEVDALVNIPGELLKLFPDLDDSILESIKEGIHDHWREPGDVEDFVRELILTRKDESWD